MDGIEMLSAICRQVSVIVKLQLPALPTFIIHDAANAKARREGGACVSACLSVCLFVGWITRTVMNGFLIKFADGVGQALRRNWVDFWWQSGVYCGLLLDHCAGFYH